MTSKPIKLDKNESVIRTFDNIYFYCNFIFNMYTDIECVMRALGR